MINPLTGIILLPCLVGLLPILFARTWQARLVAVFFGLVSLGFGACFVWGLGPRLLQRPDVPIIGALTTALASVIVTYLVDKKCNTKS